MKRLLSVMILSCLLASIVSCSKSEDDLWQDPAINYLISISFQDSQGNDLVRQLAEGLKDSQGRDLLHNSAEGLKQDDCSLDIILDNPGDKYDNSIYNWKRTEDVGMPLDDNQPFFHVIEYTQENDEKWDVISGYEPFYDGYWYLHNQFNLTTELVDFQGKLTYLIKCSKIFGDDSIHELVTYWERVSLSTGSAGKCTKAIFDGMDVKVNAIDIHNPRYDNRFQVVENQVKIHLP